MSNDEEINRLETQYAFTTNKDEFLMRLLNAAGKNMNGCEAAEYITLVHSFQKVKLR